MKKLILSALLAISFASCNQTPNGRVYVQPAPQQDVVVTPSTSQIGDQLDLQALGDVVKQSQSAEEIENKLNQSGSINNLDLDGDGQVDYVKVNEVNDNNGRGFIFLVETPNGSEQVAQITLSQSGDLANVNIQGNPTYYGSNNYYSQSHLVRDMLIYNYLFSPYHRPLYVSPYRYGHYPRTYRSYASRGYHSSPRVTTRTTTTRTSRPVTTRSSSYGGSSSYNRSNSSAYRPTTQAGTRARSSYAPTSSQKSFKVTSPAASRPKTSGFGSSSNRSSSSSSYSSRPRSSSSSSYSSRPSSSSSRSSYSSGRSSSSSRSSFGSSSRSSSRSSRR